MTTRASSAEGPQMFDDLMQSHVSRFHACEEKEGVAECAAKGKLFRRGMRGEKRRGGEISINND